MKISHAAKMFGALFSLCAIAGTARAQYVPTGTTAGGGAILVGSGSLPPLGPGAPLSSNGFNNVTLNPGSIAIGGTQDAVIFDTSGNVVVNHGTIIGGTGVNFFSPNGLSFQSGTIQGETVYNYGSITGGNGSPFNSGIGLYFTGQVVSNIAVFGNGSITGGQGVFNSGSSGANGGAALHAGGTQLSNVLINYTGPVTGGNGGSGDITLAGGNGGAGYEFGAQTITNINVTGATATGGNGGSGGGGGGGQGGDGVVFTSSTFSNVSLVFTGNVAGGNGGAEQGGGNAGQGGHAFNLSEGDSSNLSVSGVNAFGGSGGLSVAGGGGGGGSAINTGGSVVTNQSLVFSGLVLGGAGGNSGVLNSNGGSGASGLEFGAGTVTNFTFQAANAGGGKGGEGNTGGQGGIGVDFHAGTLTDINIVVPGTIAGGEGGKGLSSGAGGGRGLDIEGGSFGGVISVNAGNIIGGKGGDSFNGAGGVGGNGIYVTTNGLSGVVMNFTGNVYGGDGGVGGTTGTSSASGGSGGNGIEMGGNQIIGVSLTGVNVAGGNGAQGAGLGGGTGGVGIEMSSNLIQSVNLNFTGTIFGGNGGSDMLDGFGHDGVNAMDFGATVINGDVFNLGGAVGGSGGNTSSTNAGEGADGMNFHAGVVSNVTFNLTGYSSGGNGGSSSGTGGSGGDAGSAISISGGTFTNVTINNSGILKGGNGGTGSAANGSAGDGIVFGTGAGSNLVVNNSGYVIGGNASGTNGAGVAIAVRSGGLTINNLGNISAGGGQPFGVPAGFPAVAISLQSDNNTVNLNGHSSVNGTIQGSGVNNVINLNFTGVSPAALAALKAQLAAQGYPGSNNFTGTFTLRGVTYYVDPVVLNIGGITSYQLQGLTPNQQAIGASLDSALVNPAPGTPLFNLFNAIDASGNVPAALQALSPQSYQIYGDLAIQNATAWTQNIDARLNNVRNGSESIDTSGIGGTSDAPVTAGFSKDDSKSSKDVVQAPEEKRWGFFAAGQGLFFRADKDNVSTHANTGGVVTGVDGKAGDHAILGAFFAYDNADATLNGVRGNGATIESYTGGLYGSWHDNGFYLNGLAAYTHNDYTSTRSIVFPGFASFANGSTHGNQYTANLDGGYDWNITDRVSAGPIAGVQYVHLDVDGFNESGGLGALSIGSQNMNSLQSRLGGRIDYRLHTSNVSSASVDLHAAWQHEFLDDSRTISAGFAGSGLAGFGIRTTSPSRDAGVVGLGANFTFHDRLTLFAGYELIYYSSNYFEQTVNGGARISF